MLVQILSISSLLLAIYLLIILLQNTDFNSLSQVATEYHMGCFSPENYLNHSISIRQYLASLNPQPHSQIPSSHNFQLAHRIRYNQISKSVAKDFEKYLHEYYQIKTKNIYEQNFYRNLNLAQEKFNTCKAEVSKYFDKEECQNDWSKFLKSAQQYQELKDILKQKIQRKQQQERKISYLILDTNYSDVDEYQRNITDQITDLNKKLEDFNTKKIQILSKKSPIQIFIATNQTKLQEDQKLLDECLKNMKIITFCNDLTKELNTIKLTFSKQDIQTKIQRKKFIIDSFKNAIRNAEKIGDSQMVTLSKQSLQKNEKELDLLTASIESFDSFQESYCSKCSDQKILQLRLSIQTTRNILAQYKAQYQAFIIQQEQIGKQSVKITQRISQLEEERDFHINSNICVTPECQQQRSRDIKDQGRVLNEMKKQVLDYKIVIEEQRIQHSNQNNNLNSWTGKVSEIIDCLNKKQYYKELKSRKPTENQQYGAQIGTLQNKLVKKLQALGA